MSNLLSKTGLLLLIVIVLLGGFIEVQPVANASAALAAEPQLLVDSRWLKSHLADPKIVVVDVRERNEYASGHIPGSINIPVEETFKSRSSSKVESLSKIGAQFRRAGLQASTKTIIYDGGDLISAARFFWVGEVYGLSNLALLDGGLKAWQQGGYTLTKKVSPIAVSNYAATIRSDHLATKLSTRLAIQNNNIEIIDARAPSEYHGKKSRASRSGHIPSAINIPWTSNFFKQDGLTRLKPDAELGMQYSSIAPDKKVIAYCNRGKQSALTYFALRKLGYNVAAYDGSWLEWGNDVSLPINRIVRN